MLEESFYTRVRREIDRIQTEHPEVMNSITSCQARVKVAKRFADDSLLVFIRKGRLHVRQVIPAVGVGEDEVQAEALEDVFDLIKCSPEEKAIALSERFWERYEKAKKYAEKHTTVLGELALETRALNNVTSLLQAPWEELMPQVAFLKMIREDLKDYGTLPDFTMRRLANLESTNHAGRIKTVEELEEMQKELGDKYLYKKDKNRPGFARQEVIIAIENQK